MKRVPVKAAKNLCEENGLRQVIVIGWDGEKQHIVTYGMTKKECEEAAYASNILQEYFSWPEDYRHDVPKQIAEIKKMIKNGK